MILSERGKQIEGDLLGLKSVSVKPTNDTDKVFQTLMVDLESMEDVKNAHKKNFGFLRKSLECSKKIRSKCANFKE